MLTAIFAALVLTGDATNGRANLTPTRDQMVLRISTDRAAYYVREPVRVEASLQNAGDGAIVATLHPRCSAGFSNCKLRIYYRRSGSNFGQFAATEKTSSADAWAFPSRLEPGEKKSGTTVLAVDRASNRFVLDRPGVFEIKAVHEFEGFEVESNVVRIEVDPPGSEESDAFKALGDPELAALVQYEPRWSNASSKVTKEAAAFLQQFPRSRYSDHLRQGLVRALADRVEQKRATAEDTELYNVLKGQVDTSH
jgi:hypothetical protein